MPRMLLLCLLTAAALSGAVAIPQYHSHDFVFEAAAPGNPFDVELAGDFAGPDGARLRVPGFYDGGGRWKIRFSPTREGRWSLRTESGVAALNGRTEEAIECLPNRHPRIHGALRVDPAHPYHFIYQDGTRYFLMGYEADWLWAAPERDRRRLIEQLAARGFNHVLVNVYAHDTRWAPGKSCEWDYGPSALFPWEGNNAKPNHARLTPAFFQAYDAMLEELREHGIVAHIMIKVYNKSVNWPARWSRDEERWFRYIVARYQAFSNVVWDFSKESFNERDEVLQHRLINLVRGADAYGRLTTAHDDDAYEWDPELNRNLDFRTDQQHSDYAAFTRFDRAFRARPVLNAEFGYEYGVEKLPTHAHVNQCDWQEHLRRAYLIYFAGGYGVYYYNNTAWDVVKPDPEPPGMQRWQILRETLTSVPWWRMEPRDPLAVGAQCLALEGEAYAFYVEGDRVTANLRALASPARAAWIDTWTGARVEAGAAGAGIRRFTKPAAFQKAPAVLLVTAERR